MKPAILLILLAVSGVAADVAFDIPPIPVSLNLSGQEVPITLSGRIESIPARSQGTGRFAISLKADLAGFQDRITPLLQAELNRSDRCGERLTIENAGLIPAPPAARLTVRLHFERWACFKAFGKENAKRLAGGDGTVVVALRPEVSRRNADEAEELRINAEVTDVEADGSLGELLRSGPIGTSLQTRIRDALTGAIRRAADFNGVLPAEARPYLGVNSVVFGDEGSGRLSLRTAATLEVPAGLASSLPGIFHNRP